MILEAAQLVDLRTMDDNITSIQEALAYQEQQISDLSEIVITQGKEIEDLKFYIKKLEHKIEVLEEDITEEAEDGKSGLSVSEQAARDKPPHY